MLFSGLDNKARTGFASLFSFSKSFFPEDGIGKGAGASAGGPSLISLQRPLDSSTSSSLLSLQKPEPSSPLFHNHSHESSTMLDDVANETMDESESTLTNSLAKLSLRRTEETFRSTVYRSYQQGLANEIEEAKNSLMLLQNGPTSTIPFRPVPPLRRTLTQEEMKLVNNALSLSGSEKEIIVKGHKVEITKKDMRTLRDNGWLNDEIVNMVSNLVKDFLEMPGEGGRVPKIYLPLSFFTSKLLGDTTFIYGYDNVKRWTSRAKVDVFECDFLVFPRNITNTHWACVFMDMKSKIIWNLDSLGSSDREFSDVMLRWLRDEHFDKKKSVLDTKDWKIQGPPKTLPKQNNGVDCGLFLCMFVYFLAHGRIPTTQDFSQRDMPMLRKLVALWIIQQRVS